VAHLSDGTLRRIYDEPLGVAEVARAHFSGCARCQARFTTIAADARDLQAALAVPAATVDAGSAYRALAARVRAPRFPRLAGVRPRWRLAGAGLLAAALVAVLALTGVAGNLITIFEPTQTQPISVTQSELAGFPDLSGWGTVKVTSQPEVQSAANAQAAASATHLPLINPDPKTIPAGAPAPQYATVGQVAGSFTFSSSKAASTAQSQGHPAPPLPSNLDGSTLFLTAGPGEAAVYGQIPTGRGGEGGQAGSAQPQLPVLAIGIARAPMVTSSGATVTQIEDAVCRQPGVSADLCQQVKALGDPINTLPIPIPASKASSSTVALKGGVKATFVGDNTGVAAGLIWIRGGLVYVVAGSLSQDQLVAIANSLL
jgi:anti-sigma factor RsiW